MNVEKNITLAIDSLRGGGAQRICVNVANGLSELGWKVDLLVLNMKHNDFLKNLSKKVNLIDFKKNHLRTSTFSFIKFIYKKKPNLFLVFNYEFSVMLIILRIIFKFKYKIIARNISSLSQKKKELEQTKFLFKQFVAKLIHKFYKNADHIINQCNSMQEDLINIYPNIKKKSSVIFNPLSEEIINYVKFNDISKIEKKNYLLCVGSLKKPKALNYAIEGFAGISKNFPKLRLKIVGEGTLEKQLKKKVKDFGIENRVDFEGYQRDIIPFYTHATATVLTSIYEGFPNVLIESIYLGTPVVSFDCPSGPAEIIQNGVNGYLVKHKNIEDLKNKLSLVISSKFNFNQMNITVKKHYPKEIMQKYQKLINSIRKNNLFV